MDIFLLAGESTITGYNAVPLPDPNVPDPRIFQFGPTNKPTGTQWIPAVDPLLHFETGTNGVGPGIPFANEYMKTINPDRTVRLVGAGFGGRGFSSGAPDNWLATTPGGLVERAITQFQAGHAAAPTGSRPAGALISLGANDRNMTPTAYRDSFVAVINRIRTDMGIPGLPVIVMGISRYSMGTEPNTILIEGVNRDMPNYTYNTAYITEGNDKLKTGEEVHFSAAGQVDRGVAAARAYHRALNNWQYADPQMPGNLAIKATGPSTAEITFDMPPSRVTAFNVKWRANGGSWNVIATGISLATTYAITSAADFIEVEASTTNGAYTREPVTTSLRRPGSLYAAVKTVTANYVVTADDSAVVANFASELYVTLPDPTLATMVGRRYTVKSIGAGNVIINSGPPSAVDGGTSINLAQWGKALLVSDGTKWLTV